MCFQPEAEYMQYTARRPSLGPPLTVPPTVPWPGDGINAALRLLLPKACQPHDLLPAPQPGVHTAFWGSTWAGGTLGGHPPRVPSPAPGTPSGGRADLTAGCAAGVRRTAEVQNHSPGTHMSTPQGLRERGLSPCPSPPPHPRAGH